MRDNPSIIVQVSITVSAHFLFLLFVHHNPVAAYQKNQVVICQNKEVVCQFYEIDMIQRWHNDLEAGSRL